MVRDSLEAHKDRHAPLLRRFGAALLWRFVVGEAAGQVPSSPLPSLSISHTMKREVALSLGSHLSTHSAPIAFTCSLRRRCARCGCASSRCSSSRCSPGTSTRCTSRSGARRTMRYSSLRRRPDRSHTGYSEARPREQRGSCFWVDLGGAAGCGRRKVARCAGAQHVHDPIVSANWHGT